MRVVGDVKKDLEQHDIEIDDLPDGGANALNVYRLVIFKLLACNLFTRMLEN